MIGDEYLYKSGNNASHILIAARAMTTILGAGLGLIVFLWARRLFGNTGGLGALAFFVFCPLVISNASLVTTDLATTLWYTAAVGTYWRFICEPNGRRSLLAGVALGLLLLTKYSGLGFAAVAVALLGWRLWPIQRSRPWRRLVLGHTLLVFVAWITICQACFSRLPSAARRLRLCVGRGRPGNLPSFTASPASCEPCICFRIRISTTLPGFGCSQ